MAAATREEAVVSYRPMREGDVAYVYSTWMKWARKFAPWLHLLPDSVFWSSRFGYRAHVEAVLRRSKVIIACDPEAEDSILGYVVAEPPRLLHFVYVDRVMRNRAGGRIAESIGGGLARHALPDFGVTETVTTIDRPAFEVVSKRHKLRFDPFAAPLDGVDFRRWALAWRDGLTAFTATEKRT